MQKEYAPQGRRSAVVLLVTKGDMHNCVIFAELQPCKFPILNRQEQNVALKVLDMLKPTQGKREIILPF